MAKQTKTHAGPRRVTITEAELQVIDNIVHRLRYPMTDETAHKISDGLEKIARNAQRITPAERRAIEPSGKRLYRAYFVRKTEEHSEVMVVAASYEEARQHFTRLSADDILWAEATSSVELDDVTEVPLK